MLASVEKTAADEPPEKGKPPKHVVKLLTYKETGMTYHHEPPRLFTILLTVTWCMIVLSDSTVGLLARAAFTVPLVWTEAIDVETWYKISHLWR